MSNCFFCQEYGFSCQKICLSCLDFENVGLWNTRNCCISCHDDLEVGYDTCETYPPKSRISCGIFAIVCCSLANDTDFSSKDWKLAIDNYLKRLGI